MRKPPCQFYYIESAPPGVVLDLLIILYALVSISIIFLLMRIVRGGLFGSPRWIVAYFFRVLYDPMGSSIQNSGELLFLISAKIIFLLCVFNFQLCM